MQTSSPSTEPAAQGLDAELASLRSVLGWGGELSLLSFTVAGVQDFIAAARTTRDVWNGSYLLSYLIWQATRAMLQAIGTRAADASPMVASQHWVVLPNLAGQPFFDKARGDDVPDDELLVATFPNSVLLLVPGGESDALTIARNGEQALHSTWAEVVKKCRAPLEPVLKDGASDIWHSQTRADRVFEVYWSALAVPADDGALRRLGASLRLPAATAWGTLIQASGRLLGARKMARSLQQTSEEGHRCSLCGARSALACYPSYERSNGRQVFRGRRARVIVPHERETEAFWLRVQDEDVLRYTFRQGEHLCAVCAVRRLAPRQYFATAPELRSSAGAPDLTFPSTSTIAVGATVEGLLTRAASNPQLLDAIKTFRTSLQISLNPEGRPRVQVAGAGLPRTRAMDADTGLADLDGAWLYADSYLAKSIAREHGLEVDDAGSRVLGAAKAYSAFREALSAAGVTLRRGNYMAVIAVDGDRMGNHISGVEDSAFTRERQQDLSRKLTRFSSLAHQVVEGEFPGRLVYAGGDDLLAFVPAPCAAGVLAALQRAWTATVGDGAAAPTLSMAALMARHNDPLSAAIEMAQRLLKNDAKERLGRGAAVLYRTTDGRTAGVRVKQLEVFKAVCSAFQPDQARGGAAPVAASLVPALGRVREGLREWFSGDGPDTAWIEAAATLVQALVVRHARKGFDPAPFATLLRGCHEHLDVLRKDADNDWSRQANAFDEFVNLMVMARFIARR